MKLRDMLKPEELPKGHLTLQYVVLASIYRALLPLKQQSTKKCVKVCNKQKWQHGKIHMPCSDFDIPEPQIKVPPFAMPTQQV